jgi:hypothetical protein
MLAEVKHRAMCVFVTGLYAATAKAAAPLLSRTTAIAATASAGGRRLGP